MATINYVVTKLSNKRFLVDWPGVWANGDVGQPFDAGLARFESAHRTNTGSLIIDLYVSNESVSPVNEQVVPVWPNILSTPLPYRWILPKSPGGVTGAPTIQLLFSEV